MFFSSFFFLLSSFFLICAIFGGGGVVTLGGWDKRSMPMVAGRRMEGHQSRNEEARNKVAFSTNQNEACASSKKKKKSQLELCTPPSCSLSIPPLPSFLLPLLQQQQQQLDKAVMDELGKSWKRNPAPFFFIFFSNVNSSIIVLKRTAEKGFLPTWWTLQKGKDSSHVVTQIWFQFSFFSCSTKKGRRLVPFWKKNWILCLIWPFERLLISRIC